MKNLAKLVYESILVDDNDNFIEPDGYNLVCSECGAITCCDDKDQSEQVMQNVKFCYNCGVEFNKYL